MTGSVTLRKACSGVAPRFSAASSIERSNPVRLAVNSRTVHGIVIMMCARTSPAREPRSGHSVASSISIWNT